MAQIYGLSSAAEKYNNEIYKVLDELDDVRYRLYNAFSKMPDDSWKDDCELLDAIQQCQNLIEHCKLRCEMHARLG